MGYVAALVQWLWAPLVALGVSVVYLQNSKNITRAARIATSSHGAALAILYFGALAVYALGIARPMLGWVFWASLLLPVGLVVLSFVRYQGNKNVHFLQLGNALAAVWVWFVGTMAVTGNWL
ncbi:hypothetical protein C8239_11870 [Paracidovorax avenae]|uniref:hypothetical protein n=1 Tax=Paracidovorax avenae TaxID=80867 RepID=UPI000D221780|nr:hypothetical protein [Paracidovorax avenae]AVS85365.1 hypothetical protein C8239_11870 [Paracidovorax avenae]AVT03046.1 hypothetical protein C8243_11510 [Paracidovorax avenae]